MNKLLQDEDFVYSLPMLSVMVVKRLFRNLTRWARRVNITIDRGVLPPSEHQHIPGHKWRYFISLSFDRALPGIGWDQMKDYNSFTLLTETDWTLIGINFLTVHTDDPDKYDMYELALAACKAFGLELNKVANTDY